MWLFLKAHPRSEQFPDSPEFPIADEFVTGAQHERTPRLPDVHALASDGEHHLFGGVSKHVADLSAGKIRVAVNCEAENAVVRLAAQQLVEFDLAECVVLHQVLDDGAGDVDARSALDSLEPG